MNDIAISAKDLRKSFKSTNVLKGVDFEVRHGEIFALLGSNGAGKTTIINMLSTLSTPGVLIQLVPRAAKAHRTGLG